MTHFMIDSNGFQVDAADEAPAMIDIDGELVFAPEDAPEPTITERDMHPAHWEGVEGYTPSLDDHDQAEFMHVDLAEADLG